MHLITFPALTNTLLKYTRELRNGLLIAPIYQADALLAQF